MDNVARKKGPELVGFAEAAELLGTSTRQFLRWAKREDFPEPIARLRATPVWRRADVVRWGKKRERGIK
jgi:predicted DNA-binding transcriptional regulator AlpA